MKRKRRNAAPPRMTPRRRIVMNLCGVFAVGAAVGGIAFLLVTLSHDRSLSLTSGDAGPLLFFDVFAGICTLGWFPWKKIGAVPVIERVAYPVMAFVAPAVLLFVLLPRFATAMLPYGIPFFAAIASASLGAMAAAATSIWRTPTAGDVAETAALIVLDVAIDGATGGDSGGGFSGGGGSFGGGGASGSW